MYQCHYIGLSENDAASVNGACSFCLERKRAHLLQLNLQCSGHGFYECSCACSASLIENKFNHNAFFVAFHCSCFLSTDVYYCSGYRKKVDSCLSVCTHHAYCAI